MAKYPMYCPKCNHKEEVISSVSEYTEKVRGKRACENCGTILEPDFSPEAGRATGAVIDFKPHYSYALGKHVRTKKEMMNEAAKAGIKLNRCY